MAEKTKVADKRNIRAVYGDIVDPTDSDNLRWFSTKWEPLGETTKWMEAQIEAGKLELSKDE